MKEFKTYEESLEEAALAKIEINEIFKPAASRQRKLWKMIFSEKDASKFAFAKNMIYYQAGIPEADSPAKMEKMRAQLGGMLEIMFGLGLGDNIKQYFKEVGIEINLTHDKYEEISTFQPNDKIKSLWDLEFFGEPVPSSGKAILKKLMDNATHTESDIVQSNKFINEEIIDVACAQFDIGASAYKQAVDLTVAEKNGKSIQEKLDAIEENRKAQDKALEPFH